MGRAWLWRYEPQVYVFIVRSFRDEGLLFKGISPKIYDRRKVWTTSMTWTSSTRSSLAKSQKTTKPSAVKWYADGNDSVEIRMKQGGVSGLFRVGYGTISVSIGDVSVCIR